jgi:hypothetical protein
MDSHRSEYEAIVHDIPPCCLQYTITSPVSSQRYRLTARAVKGWQSAPQFQEALQRVRPIEGQRILELPTCTENHLAGMEKISGEEVVL